ncbi:MAG: hypothetical protein H7X92_02435, partial [Chitinophagales bacterium]|nr:hypothetical protein [Hyphomicrobiales bacterium]
MRLAFLVSVLAALFISGAASTSAAPQAAFARHLEVEYGGVVHLAQRAPGRGGAGGRGRGGGGSSIGLGIAVPLIIDGLSSQDTKPR